MNKFYNILVVMSFVVSNLGIAADKQEKPFLSLQNIDTLLNAGKYYGMFAAGFFAANAHGDDRYKKGYESCESWANFFLDSSRKNKTVENLKESFREQNILVKRAFAINQRWEKKKMVRKMACITPLYFAGALAYSKYQESKSQLKSNQ